MNGWVAICIRTSIRYPETLDKACFFFPGQKSMGGYFLASG